MGFLRYNLQYYAGELARLERTEATPQTICHAKRLLKMLDDLLAEGYSELNETLETDCCGVSRLRHYLQRHHAEPFPSLTGVAEGDVRYERQPVELTAALHTLAVTAKKSRLLCRNAFLPRLLRFCDWVGYQENTAYIFLLRDTLLPYMYYRSLGRAELCPWLLSRSSLARLTGRPNVDDVLRAVIYQALERGEGDSFERFCAAVLPAMRAALRQYPTAEQSLSGLLRGVCAERILVLGSGCAGTFPMLLKSLEWRNSRILYKWRFTFKR